jgi:hypothetical protein
MGKYFLIVTLLILFLLAWMDVFLKWYPRFLERRGASAELKLTLQRIFWLVMAILFWHTLLQRGMPEEFSITHFAYTLFVVSIYGVIKSFFNRKNSE